MPTVPPPVKNSTMLIGAIILAIGVHCLLGDGDTHYDDIAIILESLF